MRRLIKAGIAAAVGAAVAIGTASAAQVDYFMTTYANKAGVVTSGAHSLWLPFLKNTGGGQEYSFDPPGIFSLDTSTGDASLTGRAASRNMSFNGGFDVDLDLQLGSVHPMKGPKLELPKKDYVDRGGPIDPSTWSFFDLDSGMLTGFGEFAGLNFDVEFHKYPLQLGKGASGKNLDDGLAVWITVTTKADCTNSLCSQFNNPNKVLKGDINVDITPVPVPAAALLFGTALAGFAGLRRQRKAAA
ncbi:MAG: VPLPA-CTERM sorting domain-containing protein [Pseudomonadota bacterium]